MFIKYATTGIIAREGKILIGLRLKDGLWELPGGKIDAGESPQECIVREVKEELDITVEVARPLGKLAGCFRDMQMEVHPFLLKWTDGAIKLNVHSQVAWVSKQELTQYKIVEEDALVLKEFFGEQENA